MLNISNIQIEFEDLVLGKSSFTIPEHCVTLIRGFSGSGKTSLLYRVTLISEDTDFIYEIGNLNISKLSDREKCAFRKEHIAFVMQDNSLFEQYDVLGNMMLYADFNNQKYSHEQYIEFLNNVNLHVPLHQSIKTLSGGERQRLAIACALCKNTELIVLDEPTSFLDEENELHVFHVLRNIADIFKKTIIITSHSDHAIDISDEILEIKDKRLIEIKHYEEENHDTFPLTTKSFPHSFYQSYIRYFYKKYRNFEAGIIFFLSAALFILSVMIIHTDNSTEKSITSYQKMSENQIFVTKDTENKTVDTTLSPFSFTLDEYTVYPYIRTIGMLNNTPFPVLPFFSNNNIEDRLAAKYNDNGLYISFECYREIMNAMINPENISIDIVIQTDEDTYETYSHPVKIAGILDSSFQSPYLSAGNSRFLYADYSMLEEIYREYGLTGKKQYDGYTIFTDNFDTYVSLSDELSKNSYGVTLFFTYIDEMKELESINRKVKIGISSLGFIVTFFLFAIIETLYTRKRSKELMMLKLNGADNREILYVLIVNASMQCITAWFFQTILLYILSLFSPISVFYYIKLAAGFIIIVYLVNLFLLNRFVKDISVEKILRS